LVTFFNGKDHTNPPHWEIKRFTHSFINHSSRNNAKIFKIHRNLNTTPHILATQAFSSSSTSCSTYAAYMYQYLSCKQLSHSDSLAIYTWLFMHHHRSTLLLIKFAFHQKKLSKVKGKQI
jgi:hypothetical protein